MTTFGGSWTEQKAQIVEKYTQAYLQIMKERPWKTLYFDGFAGAGSIEISNSKEIEGVAKRILKINNPTSFDLYYFVELSASKAASLKKMVKKDFPEKEKFVFIVQQDCNQKLADLSVFLNKNKNEFRVLAFIDPYGMELRWESVERLKGYGLDLWLLLPTGLGTRLLTRSGRIPQKWMIKLESFLGISSETIQDTFYQKSMQTELFEEEQSLIKEKQSIQKLHTLFKNRLLSVFNYVSKPYVIRNKNNSIMYHFLLASNNRTAIKIANDIIKKYEL